MFSIHKQEAELHFFSRSEKNGTERVPAATLTLKYRTTNDVLLEFSPDLKSSFYRRPFPGEGDMADDGDTRLDDPHYLPRLKYPGMRNTIKLDHAIVGATVTLHYGIDEKSNLIFDECTVDGFELDPQDGGTVFVVLKVACYPSNFQAGELHGLQGQLVVISIDPPQDPQSSLIDD